MPDPIQFPNEDQSNQIRCVITRHEPVSQRTLTPSLAVFEKSAGVFHCTPEGRRLYDFSSGVLVANLGHNPTRWIERFCDYVGWHPAGDISGQDVEYRPAVPMTAYNAVTPIESIAVKRLLQSVQATSGGRRLDTVMWAASGSEAIQKALWACLHHDSTRDIILATRHGFHGKKGLAGAITGSETSPDRDSRVVFIGFPMGEVDDMSCYGREIDLSPYRAELDAAWNQYGRRLNCLCTEPYLGGGGSYHPPASYLQLLERFCREHDILLILDEIQSNFGRTGRMYAFETHGLEPDFVTLGKGMGNGFPVSAAVGRGDVFASLTYGEGSDTWSANPFACAAVVATLDEFESTDVLRNAERLSSLFFAGLERLKETGMIAKVRGEGMVFGIEAASVGDRTANDVAVEIVKACYLGKTAEDDNSPSGDGIHLLGPLAGTVIRVSPPMTMTESEATASLDLMYRILNHLAQQL